jgi:hypothetical protein
MSAFIRPMRPEDRETVVALLHTHMSSKIPPERWALLFDYPWRPSDAPDCGRVLEENGRIVGCLCATYVDRGSGDGTQRICNMSSWYLLRPYRGQGHGRAMALDLIADSEVTYTDLTATPQVHQMLTAHADFSVLDAERWIVRHSFAAGAGAISLEDVAPETAPFGDHLGLPGLRFLHAKGQSGSCRFAVQVKRKGEGVLYHQLLHADDPAWLAQHAGAVAVALLGEDRAVLAIDRRLVPFAPQGAEAEPIAQPRLYKSRRLRPEQIDNLYNEVLLLDQKLP